MGNKTKQPDKKKNKVADIILTTVGIVLLLITAVGVISKFVSKDAMVFGSRSDVVLTSSMATISEDVKDDYEANGWTNQLRVHDLIITSRVKNEEEIQIGDIVTYHNPISGVTTHRIVGIKEYQGKAYFTIRGDAVEKRNVDGDFPFDSIIGKVTNNYGQVGQVVYFFQSIYGVIMMVGLAMICFTYSFLADYIDNKKNKNNNEKIN